MVNVSRRDFLKISAGAGAAATFMSTGALQNALQLIGTAGAYGNKLVWIQGQSCNGCTISGIQWNGNDTTGYSANLYETLDNIGSDLEFHPTLMNEAGCYISEDTVEFEIYEEDPNNVHVDAMNHLDSVFEDAGSGKVTLVIEGSIPYPKYGDMEAGFCEVGMKNQGGGKYEGMWEFCDIVTHIVRNYEDKLAAVVAYGSCAAFAGIPGGNPNPTGAKGVMHFFEDLTEGKVPGRDYQYDTSNIKLVNLPACPGHPDWLILTYATVLNLPSSTLVTDRWLRPTQLAAGTSPNDFDVNLFGRPAHADCERKPAFDAGEIARNWFEAIDNPEKCLLKLGCRGVDAWTDCPTRLWNKDPEQEVTGNWCVAAGAPCNACCSTIYPDNVFLSSFFAEATHSDLSDQLRGQMPESTLACYTCHNTTMPRMNKEWM